MKIQLTDRYLRTHRPDGNEEVFDVGTRGFGARIGTRGASFFCVYRRGGKKFRNNIGTYSPNGDGETSFTLAQARTRAEKIRGTKAHPVAAIRRAKAAGTFREVAAKFLEELPRGKETAGEVELRKATTETYRRLLDRKKLESESEEKFQEARRYKLIPRFGDYPLHEITEVEVKDFFADMVKKNKTPIHANRTFMLLRRILNWSVEQGWLDESPCKRIKFPAGKLPGGKERPREKTWSSEQIRAVWNAAGVERPLLARYFRFLLYTGCRRGEAMKMEWSWIDVDAEHSVLRIPASANKSGENKNIPLSPQALRLLTGLREINGNLPNVFAGPTGKTMVTIQKAKDRIAKRAEVSFRTHDLRHCVASGMVRLGVPTDTISAVLGHSIGQRVTRTYASAPREEQMREALNRWANRLDQIVTETSAKVIPIHA